MSGVHRALGRSRWLSLLSLLTVGAAIVLAHEGHAPLPTKGAEVNAEKGTLLLTTDARESVDVAGTRPPYEVGPGAADMIGP